MKTALVLFCVAAIIMISGCTQNTAIKEISIPGHQETYIFSNDIREALKVPINDAFGTRQMFLMNNKFNIIFDGSSAQDNAYFRVVLINLGKISIFMGYEGKIMSFDYYYYVGDQWYNSTGGNITAPQLNNTIWLMGPETGARETSLLLNGTTVYLQGTSYNNLTLAGDKLTLTVFGIDRID